MKLSHVVAFAFGLYSVGAAATENTETEGALPVFEPFVFKREDMNDEVVDANTQKEVVIVVKEVVEGMLDAFKDFGDAAGVSLETMLKDTGYNVEMSEEKRNKIVLKRRSGFLAISLGLLHVVLGGIARISLKFEENSGMSMVGKAAEAINFLLP